MADVSSLGRLLAQKIDFTTSPWLAQYMFERAPKSAVRNASLPRDLVDQILDSPDIGEYGASLAGLHEFSRAQFLAVANSIPVGEQLCLWASQRPPTALDLLEYLERTKNKDVASYALDNSEWSRVNELDREQQERIAALALPASCVAWMAQFESLSDDDLRRIEEWSVASMRHDEPAFSLLVHNHPERLQDFLDMDRFVLNYALAGSQHLKDVIQQRAVAHLGNAKPLPAHYDMEWLASNADIARRLAWNPRTRPGVLRELERLANSALEYDEGEYQTAGGYALQAQLDARRGDHNQWLHTSQEYEAIKEKSILEWLVTRTAQEVGQHSRVQMAQQLLENPNLDDFQRDELEESLGVAVLFDEARGVEPVQETQDYVRSARNGVGYGLRLRDHIEVFILYASQNFAVTRAHSKYFIQALGERKEAWDALLALSGTWEGSVEGLITTVQNLL